jgi:flagellar motor protein MotB
MEQPSCVNDIVSDQEPQLPTQAQISLEKYFADMRFARATELAQLNRLVEAEMLLSPDGIPPDNSRELDLLARIAVRNRKFAEARQIWEKILRNDPTDESAKAALSGLNLSSIAFIIAKRVAFFLGIVVGLGLAAIGLMATFAHFHKMEARSLGSIPSQAQQAEVQSHTPAHEPSVPLAIPDSSLQTLSAIARELSNNIVDRLQRIQDEQSGALMAEIKLLQTNQTTISKSQNDVAVEMGTLSQSLETLVTQQRNVEKRIEQAQKEIHALYAANELAMQALTNVRPAVVREAHLGFNLKGITLISLQGTWIIRFDKGLFDRDDHLKMGARDLLRSAAKALVQTQDKLRVEVIGFADNEVPTWPWSKVLSDERIGLIRSKKVQQFLEGLDIFPPNAVTAINGSSNERPFPNGSDDNRTVVLRIHRE